jgi:hypothetical protein
LTTSTLLEKFRKFTKKTRKIENLSKLLIFEDKEAYFLAVLFGKKRRFFRRKQHRFKDAQYSENI